jgi:tight adherence protein B
VDFLYYLFVVLGFFAVVLFLEGIFLTLNAYKGPEKTRIAKRLQAISASGSRGQGTTLAKQRLLAQTPEVQKLLLSIPRIHLLDRLLLQSGIDLSVAAFLGITVIFALFGAVIAVFLGFPLFLLIVVAIAAGALPLVYILSAKSKRMTVIENQLPDALDLMGRAMRAGHAFPSALRMVGNEMSEPIASEFRTVFEEINYGISTQEALTNLGKRVPSTDLSYFVIAVLIQHETGGNLSELLGNISTIIRERLKLMGTIRVLSAEGKLSAWILTLLPFVLGVTLQTVNPGFLNVLWTDPIGIKMSIIALCMMVLGIFAMSRIIKIRV